MKNKDIETLKKIVWNTLKEDIPQLKEQIQKLL